MVEAGPILVDVDMQNAYVCRRRVVVKLIYTIINTIKPYVLKMIYKILFKLTAYMIYYSIGAKIKSQNLNWG